jgi:hypothetical protein
VSKIFHEFIITKRIDKSAAYLLSHEARRVEPNAIHYGEATGEISAWTTLAAAKQHAKDAVGRLRMAWDEIPDVDRTTWSCDVIEEVS